MSEEKDKMKTKEKTEPGEKPGGNYIMQAWLVIFLAFIFAAALTFVQVSLSGKIEENKRNETYSQIPNLVPGAVKNDTQVVKSGDSNVYRAMKGDQQVGWVIPAKGGGFAADIEILIGVDPKVEKITGIYILAQQETPGLGNKISESEWRSQFNDKSTAQALEVTKMAVSKENQIKSVTGATISSDSVTKIVNDTISKLKPDLASQAK
jgi:electron transport complex protein RnfG